MTAGSGRSTVQDELLRALVRSGEYHAQDQTAPAGREFRAFR